jgi:hypothetical protein
MEVVTQAESVLVTQAESVLDKPISFEDVLRSEGYTAADFRHIRVVAELGESAFEEFLAENGKRIESDKATRAIARAILKHQRGE